MSEPTKPRGPIAAMYSSPGPCYLLPSVIGKTNHDPRSTHKNAPAFPFGIKHGEWRNDCSPGPCYAIQPKLYREGYDGAPKYSIYGRNGYKHKVNNPGPGVYSPEKTGFHGYNTPPAYSFGSRHEYMKSDQTPAASKYTLPSMIGKTTQSNKRGAPCHSMVGRSKIGGFHEDLQKTPGPSVYSVVNNEIFKKKAAQYSITGRNVIPGDTTRKPGPGAHYPEKVLPFNIYY
ncbi:Outer dense fiber of sperm tails protein 3 [Intoshia linei]|uniref:Outer dense fiber of sperm tails protein 3 n=1 Tax=Intoshia linei TaxID=1819745 RepID=A0A177AXH8_9BILA|nr:Outer dense fiber of sperm tails protein 3 [Intoshia linei]